MGTPVTCAQRLTEKLTKTDSRSGSPSWMRCSNAVPTPAPGVKPGLCATSSSTKPATPRSSPGCWAHLQGEPVSTRSFEEREGPLRALNDADLWDALHDRMAALNDVAAAGDEIAEDSGDADVAWTGRTMKVPWFAEHMREELVLHGWDITGDDGAARARLAEPWMTTHSVLAVGRPLLAKGAARLRPGERIEARLRVPGANDVLVSADADCTSIGLVDPEGPATLETDAAARVLLLWGRRPGDPSRICSRVGPETLGRVRRLLSGY